MRPAVMLILVMTMLSACAGGRWTQPTKSYADAERDLEARKGLGVRGLTPVFLTLCFSPGSRHIHDAFWGNRNCPVLPVHRLAGAHKRP